LEFSTAELDNLIVGAGSMRLRLVYFFATKWAKLAGTGGRRGSPEFFGKNSPILEKGVGLEVSY